MRPRRQRSRPSSVETKDRPEDPERIGLSYGLRFVPAAVTDQTRYFARSANGPFDVTCLPRPRIRQHWSIVKRGPGEAPMPVADRHSAKSKGPCVGVGFKPEHFEAILDTRPKLGFFEVHAENYMGAGGPPHRRLDAIRELYPLSLHGVGLSIGSPGPLDHAHLKRLAAVAKRFEPAIVSEHLAWSTHEGAFLNDLLPLPYTHETLARVSEHIDQVQTALGRT